MKCSFLYKLEVHFGVSQGFLASLKRALGEFRAFFLGLDGGFTGIGITYKNESFMVVTVAVWGGAPQYIIV